MRFSQRYGHTPVKAVIQIESIDQDLRNALWSLLKLHFWDTIQPDGHYLHPQLRLSTYGNEEMALLCQRLWLDFFKIPLDTLPDKWEPICDQIRKFYFECKWYEVYDFIEFIAQNYPDEKRSIDFAQGANVFLEREVSAYRFVDGHVVQITDPVEIEAIETAAAVQKGPVQEHLERALQLLSDRRAPDYRNSIKESISAVEALTRGAVGSDKGTLGDLLKRLGRSQPLHPALESAFSKLYGYTSDAHGIRHALLGEDRVTFEEAKFMLVACSAFANYVRGVLKA